MLQTPGLSRLMSCRHQPVYLFGACGGHGGHDQVVPRITLQQGVDQWASSLHFAHRGAVQPDPWDRPGRWHDQAQSLTPQVSERMLTPDPSPDKRCQQIERS